MGKVLVIDDEPGVLFAFEEMLGSSGHEAVLLDRADTALGIIPKEKPDVVIMDIFIPGMKGLEAIQHIKRDFPNLPVIIITGQGTMDLAIEATRLGAFDYQLKPFKPQQMLRIIENALASMRLAERQVDLNPPGTAEPSHDAIIGQTPEMQEIYKAIGRVAGTDATVLVRGESGTGKELVVRALYQYSQREGPMVVVNCAAIPEALLEAELFGHERGAFTGAESRRIGKFEQASSGTIFLDEIGEIPLSVQAKILRVLQERRFERVGSNESILVDVRVLAATNRELEHGIRGGTFREDLYHRLNVVTIDLPPLRQRKDDIPQLTDYFLDRFSRELKIARPAIAEDARNLLDAYDWPGNVRQLEHCIYRAMIFTRGHPIQEANIRDALERPARPSAAGTPEFDDMAVDLLVRSYLDSRAGPGTLDEFLEKVERSMLMEALRRGGGIQSQAARRLGLRRPTIHAKLRRFGLIEGPEEPSEAEG